MYATESEDPPSVNPSSVDENMEDSDAEKDSDSKSTTVKASSSMSGLDEYEFKDEEEEEEDLSKALNDRHILRRELRQKEKEEKERNHYASKQGSKSDQSTPMCKSKKTKASRVYCSSDSSSDEAEEPTERRNSPTRSVSVDGRSKKESLTLTPVEQKEKGKQKKKNKSQSKNKENQEVREEGKEKSKSLLFSSATVSDNSDKSVREEDSFKMSFSTKDDTSVHLFHLSVVKSPKLNHSQTDKQTTPLKQENAKTCVSIADGSCPGDGVKYNHYTDTDFCTEGSSSKSCKHKEKSKHHHKELNLEGDDGSCSPFKDSSLSNSMDSSEAVFRKTEKDEKVVKKHKLKHKEKEKYRKEYEAEKNRHLQKEPRKDGHRNMEFDREFWKENFFKSDENEELSGKCEMPVGGSPTKSSDSSPVKEERGVSKDKHLSSSSSKDRRPKEEREKNKSIKKEKKEVHLKEEQRKDGKGDEVDEQSTGLGSGRIPDSSLHSSGVKEEVDDKPVTGNSADQDQLESPEKTSREKNDKRPPTKDRDSDKKHTDKDKKVKSEHLADKTEPHNSTDRWKEKEKLTNISHSPNDKSHKDGDKLKAMYLLKKHEENKKNKDKLDKRAEKEHPSGDHKDKTSSEKKGKAPEKTTDHGKSDRSKEKERDKDSDKRKKEKSKETTPSSSSYSNLKLLLEEKKGYVCENNKVVSSKSKEEATKPPEKDRDRRERDRESEKHRDRERDRHKEKDKDRSQLNRDSKISKLKTSEVDTKSKVAPTLKDTRPKEKRLVNDDLMQTSFERMLSLKDQEIEQWHRKHLEKIKQKERERLKLRPGIDPGKQKSKEKSKTSSSSSEPCPTKELTRSKSSEVPDGHREKVLKDATSGRTISLDTKTFGKNGPVIENNLSPSPRPESEKSGIMSRSVSMISVASSEDSGHATILTPRPTEYDSDMNMDASDAQPPFLQSSFIVQSSRSPTVQDKDTSSLPETSLCNRTPSRHASPCLRAILDEVTKVPPAETRLTEESRIISIASQQSSEKAAVLTTEISLLPVQENQSSQSLTSALPESENLTSNEGEGVTPVSPVQPSSHLQESCAKNPSSLTQANSMFQTHLQDQNSSCNTSSQVEHASLGQLDIPGARMTEGSNKESSQVASLQSSHAQNSSDTSPRLNSSSQQWETGPISSSEQTLTADSSLRPEQREKPLVVSENKVKRSGENISKTDCTPSTSIGSCRSSSEETIKPLLKTTSVQEDSEKGDARLEDESTSRFSSDPLVTVNAQQEKHEQGIYAASATNLSRCASPERIPEEPMEVSEDVLDENRITETDGAKVLASGEGATTQALSESKADIEASDQLAAEEKQIKSDLQDNEEQGQSSTAVQPDHQAEPPSSSTSGSSSPISVVERDSDSSGARAKVRLFEEEEADIQLTHPRKRKMPRVSPPAEVNLTAQEVKEKTQQSLAAIVDALKLDEIQPYQTERANPYYEYLHIRKKIEEKRKVLCSVIPQAPQYYDEYVTFNGSYLLDGNPLSKLCIPTVCFHSVKVTKLSLAEV